MYSPTDSLDGGLEPLHVLFARIPQDCGIGLMVIVPENVADAGDGSPRDLRFVFLELSGKATAGFGKNLEVSFNQLSRAPVRAKLLEVIPHGVRLDVVNGLEDVADIDSSVLLH